MCVAIQSRLGSNSYDDFFAQLQVVAQVQVAPQSHFWLQSQEPDLQLQPLFVVFFSAEVIVFSFSVASGSNSRLVVVTDADGAAKKTLQWKQI